MPWSLRAVVLVLAALTLSAAAPSPTPEKVSRFNEYRGYSAPVYDGWVRSSRYVTVRDGTRLAMDIIRPSRGGVLVLRERDGRVRE